MLKKNYFAIFGLVLALLAFGTLPAAAQQSEFAAPARLMLKGDAAEDEQRGPMREAFYPIGWSKDGKFAFYVEPADEACGCYISHFVIQDLRTDKVLWEKKYMGDEQGDENQPAETLETYWQRNRAEFSARLNEHGIVAAPRFALLGGAFDYEKDKFTPRLAFNAKMNDDLEVTGGVSLRLISKTKGGKTIYEKKYNKEYAGILGSELGGSLLSPFEPRAAVLVVETYRGWEGPPNVTRVRVVGAALAGGFQ